MQICNNHQYTKEEKKKKEVKQIFHQPEHRNYTMKISPDVLNNVNSLMVKVL